MDTIKTLRLTIIMQWFFIIVGSTIGIYEEQYLPVELLNYINAEAEAEFTNFELAIFSISVLMILALLYTSVGVYRLRPWARKPYTIIIFSIVIAYLFIGVEIITPISASLDYFGTLTMGVTLGILYFSDSSSNFDTTSNK